MKEKHCPRCNTNKPLDEFYSTKATPDGKVYACKSCINSYNRNRWKTNDTLRLKRNKYRSDYRTKHIDKHLYELAKKRAAARKIEFSIDLQDVIVPKVCPILGIELVRGGELNCTPSLDRINSNLGYVKGNVQVISHRANTLKSDGTLEEFEKLVLFLKKI